MLGSKPSSTHIDLNHIISQNNEGKTMDKGHYQQLLERLIYLSHTQSNIAYVVSVVSQCIHYTKEEHFQVVQKILVLHLGKGSCLKSED